MRLIDAEVLERKIKAFLKDLPNGNYHYQNWMCVVDDTPTIDAEPVIHGKWIPLYPHEVAITNEYKCSVCGLGFDEDEETECVVYDTFKYCPHCGAKMDEVNDEVN